MKLKQNYNKRNYGNYDYTRDNTIWEAEKHA